MQYTNKLIYDLKVPQKNNNAKLESNLQKLTNDNLKVLNQFRQLNRLPPVIIEHDSNQGFYVKAACDIPELTLIAEYCGEVKTEL